MAIVITCILIFIAVMICISFSAISHIVDQNKINEQILRDNRNLLFEIKQHSLQAERFHNSMRSENNSNQIETMFLTCGGCGRSVPSLDGFNPVEHSCPALAMIPSPDKDAPANFHAETK